MAPSFRIMGIVNVTPDSFSDGGEWFDATRPSARACGSPRRAPTSSTSAASRPAPAPTPCRRRGAAPRHPGDRGPRRRGRADQRRHDRSSRSPRRARRRRDVRQRRLGVRHDPALAARRRHGRVCCLMHMLGEPRTMQDDPPTTTSSPTSRRSSTGASRSRSPRASPQERIASTPDRLRQDRRAQPRAAPPPGRDRRPRVPRAGRDVAQGVPRTARRPRRPARPRRRDRRDERAGVRARRDAREAALHVAKQLRLSSVSARPAQLTATKRCSDRASSD